MPDKLEDLPLRVLRSIAIGWQTHFWFGTTASRSRGLLRRGSEVPTYVSLLKLVPGQSPHLALTLRQHREHRIVMIGQPDLTEKPRPKLARYRQQSWLFLIELALIHKIKLSSAVTRLRIVSRSDPSLDTIVTCMRHELSTARIVRELVSSVTTAWNPSRVRNAMTPSSKCPSLWAPTVSFQARDNETKPAINHLAPGEKLTSHTQQAPA
jgi:hypothetical protein